MILTVDAPFVCVPYRPGDDVVSLVSAVAAADPDHVPTVAAGDDTVTAWMARKPLNAAWVAFASDGQVIGHVGVRFNDTAADGTRAPAGRVFEVARLLVHPDHRRTGVATALMRVATHHAHADRVWLTAAEGSPAESMYRSAGWVEVASVTFVADPRPGVMFVPGEPCKGS